MDKVISTLALHWVSSIDKGLKELKRILKPKGSIDILMIEKNDGKDKKNIAATRKNKGISRRSKKNCNKIIK